MSTRTEHFKCSMYSSSIIPAYNLALVQPKSLIFFLLKSRADLDLMAVLQTPFNYSVIRTRFFKKSPQSVVAPFNERLYVLSGRAIKGCEPHRVGRPTCIKSPCYYDGFSDFSSLINRLITSKASTFLTLPK